MLTEIYPSGTLSKEFTKIISVIGHSLKIRSADNIALCRANCISVLMLPLDVSALMSLCDTLVELKIGETFTLY